MLAVPRIPPCVAVTVPLPAVAPALKVVVAPLVGEKAPSPAVETDHGGATVTGFV
jgi:hypothetical protein